MLLYFERCSYECLECLISVQYVIKYEVDKEMCTLDQN